MAYRLILSGKADSTRYGEITVEFSLPDLCDSEAEAKELVDSLCYFIKRGIDGEEILLVVASKEETTPDIFIGEDFKDMDGHILDSKGEEIDSSFLNLELNFIDGRIAPISIEGYKIIEMP